MAETTKALGSEERSQDTPENDVDTATLAEAERLFEICRKLDKHTPDNDVDPATLAVAERHTSECSKSEPFSSSDEKEENEDSIVITKSTLKVRNAKSGETTLKLRDNEDILKYEGTASKKPSFLVHCLGMAQFLFKERRNLQSNTWSTDITRNNAWLLESHHDLKVADRTEDMESRIKQLKENEIYRMTDGGKKLCLIIGNTTFKGKKELGACAIDCDYLIALFKALKFEVKDRRDLTAKEMKKFLEEEKNELHDIECFVCAITSHGNAKGALGSDRKEIEYQKILEKFDRDNCPALSNKPKLFLFDFCRGKKEEGAITRKDQDTTDDTMVPPLKSDFLVARSSVEDYVSFCDGRYGSWFIRSFVKVVSDNACRCSILEMLVMVNEHVGRFVSDENGKQSAQFDCSMRKQFFFPLPVKPRIRQPADTTANEQTTSKPIEEVTC